MVVSGLAELEAAKQLLLTSLRAVVPDEELLVSCSSWKPSETVCGRPIMC